MNYILLGNTDAAAVVTSSISTNVTVVAIITVRIHLTIAVIVVCIPCSFGQQPLI